MTLEACYEQLGGSYADVSRRLPSPALIEKFVGRFLEDQSFEALCAALEAGNRPEAFRAAHTLKGVCANLGFSRLLSSSERLTEELRGEGDAVPATAGTLLEEVRRDYQATADAIRTYLGRA